MKKLCGILATLALTVFAALPSEAGQAPWYYYCDVASQCPDVLDCQITGCVNHTCDYACWW